MTVRHLGMLLAGLAASACTTSVHSDPPDHTGVAGLEDTGDTYTQQDLPDSAGTQDTGDPAPADSGGAFAGDSGTGARGGTAHTGLPPCPGTDPYEVPNHGPNRVPTAVFGLPYPTGVQQAGDHFATFGAFLDGPESDVDRYQVTVPPGCELDVFAAANTWAWLHVRVDAPFHTRHQADGPAVQVRVLNPSDVAHTTDVMIGYRQLTLPYERRAICLDYDLELDLACPHTGTPVDTAIDTGAEDTALPSGTADAVWIYKLPNQSTAAPGGRPGLDALARQSLPGRLGNRPSRRWRARGFVSEVGDALIDLPATSGLPAHVPVFAVDAGGEATRLGADWADLFDGTWDAELQEPLELLDFFELGFLSGTAPDGTATGEDCDAWSSTSSAHAASVGITTSAVAPLGPFPTASAATCSPVTITSWFGAPRPVVLGVAWCTDGCDVPPDPTCPSDPREVDDGTGGTAIVVDLGQTVVVEGVVDGTETDTVTMTMTDPSCSVHLDVEGDDRMLHGAVVHQDLAVQPQTNGLVSGSVGFDVRGMPTGAVATLTLTGTDPDVCLPWTATYTQTWCP